MMPSSVNAANALKRLLLLFISVFLRFAGISVYLGEGVIVDAFGLSRNFTRTQTIGCVYGQTFG
jgi:hypothetical protein